MQKWGIWLKNSKLIKTSEKIEKPIMVKCKKYLFILFLFCSFHTDGKTVKLTNDSALQTAQSWFKAWELVSQHIYKLKTYSPVEFVFFDEEYVYSTSTVSVPNGEIIDGPALFDKKFIWKKAAHSGMLTLPDSQRVPVGLMSFASPLEAKKSFFVMPLVSFWKTAGVISNEIGIELLVTGVFLHEFSHTQQMQNFGKRMSEYEANNTFAVSFSDDIVQDYFSKDSLYEKRFREEVSMFYEASAAKDKSTLKKLTAQALRMHGTRQKDYFTGEHNILKEIDDFFLTMEGLGQYSMYAWLIHTNGGNVAPNIALKAVRRGGKYWSQEEGLSLFLLLNKFVKPAKFGSLMFGNETVSAVNLIKKNIAVQN